MVAADILLLTIPFSVLRGVELRIDLPPKKLKAINELAYGANTKLIAGFNSRPWRNQSYSGDAFSDLGAQLCWDSGRFQAGDQSSLTVYLGGKLSLQAGAGSSRERVKQELPALDKLFPGTSAEFNDRIVRMHWPEKEFSLGSYSAYRVGQWTDIAGAEGEPCGDLFFAGEHCSRDFQGYMNGAVESGRIAAEAIAQRVLAVKFGHQEAI